jgi:hypothetical protein
VHFGIEAFQGHIAIQLTLRGENELRGIGWQPHQPSDGFEVVSTPEFDMALVIVVQSHILESV